MGYKQNNPFSRFSYESPLNSFDSLVAKLMKQGKSKESATKIAGSVANAKMHGAGSGPTAAQKARHGMSRESSELKDMPVVDIEKGDAEGDKGPSRKSSSPLNTEGHGGTSGHTHRVKPDYSDYEEQQKRHNYQEPEPVDERSGKRFPGAKDGQRDATTFLKSHPNYISREDWANATDEQKGISRESSSPLNDNGYNTPNPNWNQKKHDRQVKRASRKLRKGKGLKLDKFGPEVIMDVMRKDWKDGEKQMGGVSRTSSSPLNDMNHKGMSPKELHDHGMVEHPAKRPDSFEKPGKEKPNRKKKKKEINTGRPAPKKGVSRKVSAKRAKKMVEKGKGVMDYKVGGGFQGRGKPRLEGHNPGEEHNKGRFTKIKRKHRTGKERTSYSSTELGKSMDVR